ncbi:MAG: CPBP family intramembrane metalloprotease [Candidatus Omnitrophica bacterium]|nr:CPBP family intramembrane metalloprotease [Candidatus Omnitrophota bacterium]
MARFGLVVFQSAIRNPQSAMAMIQRLLRGRLLYLVFSLLLVALHYYVGTGVLVPIAPLDLAQVPETDLSPAASAGDHLSWWPEAFDLAALQRIAVQHPFLATFLSILTSCAIGLGLAGFAIAWRALRTGRIRSVWRFTSRRLPSWSFGEAGRIALLTLLMAGLLPVLYLLVVSRWGAGWLDAHLRLTVSMLFLDAFAILVILTFAAGKGPSLGRTFGLSSQNKPVASIAAGLHGYVAVFPWLFVLLVIMVELARALGLEPPIEPIQRLIFQEDRALVLGLTALLTCVVGPVAEELFFRGVVYPAIRQRTSWGIAILVSGALFGLLHANPVGFPAIFLLGCLLANLYERTGSLAGPLTVHVLHNTFLMSMAFAFRQLMALT